MGHDLENTGDQTLTFLEMFRSDHQLVNADLNLDDASIAALPRIKPVAAPSPSQPSLGRVSASSVPVPGRDRFLKGESSRCTGPTTFQEEEQ